MKQKINIIGGIILSLIFSILIFSGCEDYNPMKNGIVDFNGKITGIDKTIAQPGDTVTLTGTELDKVYKIMLSDKTVPVTFMSTATELKFVVPANAPLGDVIVINIFFSGKGLAQKTIELISPPVILALSPVAAQGGTPLKILGSELYKAKKVKIGGVEASFTIVDDKQLTTTVPDGFTGGYVEIITATGAVVTSPSALIYGTEILITDFDNSSNYYSSLSSNGNMDGDKEESEAMPRGKYWTFTITDNNTSWGGNVDFYLKNLPTGFDNSKISLSLDMKLSAPLNVNVMVQGPANVYGKTSSYNAGWQTITLPFSEMGTGYGSGDPIGNVEPFNTLTAVKIQPPAGASDGNFGKTVSIDNIKFIIAN
ncbi:hypothetical protein TRIP_D440414 [uncultured Paludibacter sp.]|nr:hypothetical protein TRIP_D440414 [uncultured Paludibacter sp.]